MGGKQKLERKKDMIFFGRKKETAEFVLESRRFNRKQQSQIPQKLWFSPRFLRFDPSQIEGNISFILALFTGFRVDHMIYLDFIISYFIIIILYSLEGGYSNEH